MSLSLPLGILVLLLRVLTCGPGIEEAAIQVPMPANVTIDAYNPDTSLHWGIQKHDLKASLDDGSS